MGILLHGSFTSDFLAGAAERLNWTAARSNASLRTLMDVTCIWESGMFILGNDNKYSLTFAFANLFCYRTQTICQNPKVTSEGHATFLLILSSLQMNGCPNCSSKISQKGGVTAFHFPGLSSWKGMSFIDTNAPLLGRNSLFHRCYKDGIWYSFLFVCFCFVSVFWGGMLFL